VHLSRRDDAIDLHGTWLYRKGDAPAWGQWDHEQGSAAAKIEAEKFREIAGVGFAGHAGIVPADIGGRQRRIQEVYERYKGNTNVHALTEGKGNPLSPKEAREALVVSDGLSIDTVLAEPEVKQPLYVDFDERGRMWVVQYIQYPNPAGLEVLTWDNHLRKVFDAVPPPPPFDRPEHQKFRGKDKITIHEDADGDGVFESHKTFLDGLNMCTSLAFDEDGVWVMHAPYLLFYPDRNHDDIPDGPPEVHLSGFGLEDTHSIANSLKWGPDGWLYGATGSTVTARVKVEQGNSGEVFPFFGQNIWRYDPKNHRFELFAEGGWNTFGVDFDSKGRLYSGTNGNLQSVYFVQGGYYQKSFGKHGPHTNPYTFGHFFGLPIEGEKVRLVHQWVLYESGAIPSLSQHFVGSNSLANKVHALRIAPDGSTFKTVEIDPPVQTQDKWFRPVHTVIGPDGAIYLSDWYDARITHVDPRDNWDRERGRIYRLRDATRKPGYHLRMDRMDTEQLIASLSDQNQWVRSTARRLLRDRKDEVVVSLLQERLVNADARTALEALWTLGQMKQLDEATLLQSLKHPDPHVRLWSVRLMGDASQTLSSAIYEVIMKMAKADTHPEVISQLAASAQRLPSAQGYPLVQGLFQREEWLSDPYIPQQIWWALESQIRRQPEGILNLLETAEQWQHGLLRETLLSRISRRLMAEQKEDSLSICAKLLIRAPDKDAVSALLQGMELALQGSRLDVLPPELDQALQTVTSRFGSDSAWIGFGLRIGSQSAFDSARQIIAKPQYPGELRTAMINRLSELRDNQTVSVLLHLIEEETLAETLKLAAMNGLRRFDEDSIGDVLLEQLPMLNGNLLQTAQSVLAGRTEWATRLLMAVDQGKVSRESIPFDILITLQQRPNDRIKELIRSNWGNLRQPEAAIAQRISEVEVTLKQFEGNPFSGKELFDQTCGACHVLHGQGRPIGPELTGYDRGNLEFLLPAILDPNLAIREEFELVTVTLRPESCKSEGALLTGFISGLEGGVMTLTDIAGNRSVISETDVIKRDHSSLSIMPEGLLDTMSQQQIADLFAYLQN
jgi:putative heme-binding domain-containing protein